MKKIFGLVIMTKKEWRDETAEFYFKGYKDGIKREEKNKEQK